MIYQDGDDFSFAITLLIVLVVGLLLFLPTRVEKKEITHKSGFLIVSLAWIFAGTFGALPYIIQDIFGQGWSGVGIVNALFESFSGFTTTGASVLTDIESLPHGILFWRSMTHWLGGMGIILLSVAILPLLGVGGMQLYKAEVPSPIKDKLLPKIADTAKVLWLVYLLVTLVEIILLYLFGMSGFDAVCHTFGTVATGGFSTKTASIGYYNSKTFEIIFMVFMIIAGANFALHYQGLKGNLKAFYKNEEFKFFIKIIGFFIIVLTLNLYYSEIYSSIGEALRYASFQVIAICTTTGYATADFDKWTDFSRFILVFLMFVGGSAGSTGGSIKVLRILLIIKLAYRELYCLIHPRAVVPIKISGQSVSDDIIKSVYGFFFLYLGLFLLGTFIMSLLGLDFLTSVTAVAATIGNIGPGLGSIGPAFNYAHLPVLGKIVCILCMVFGRLEIYTLLILFIPSFWRK